MTEKCFGCLNLQTPILSNWQTIGGKSSATEEIQGTQSSIRSLLLMMYLMYCALLQEQALETSWHLKFDAGFKHASFRISVKKLSEAACPNAKRELKRRPKLSKPQFDKWTGFSKRDFSVASGCIEWKYCFELLQGKVSNNLYILGSVHAYLCVFLSYIFPSCPCLCASPYQYIGLFSRTDLNNVHY